jgi:hypothetical protein
MEGKNVTVSDNNNDVEDDIAKRIAENHQKALALLEKNRQNKKIKEILNVENKVKNSEKSLEVFCDRIITEFDEPKPCGKPLSSKDMVLYENFKEKCCTSCQLKDYPDYEYISRGDMIEEYLLPLDTIKMMKFINKNNPKNPMWKPMKLYLVKHAKQKAYERFMNQDGLESEKKRRESIKFKKQMESVDQIFSSSLEETSQNLLLNFNENVYDATNITNIPHENLTGKNKRKNSSSISSNKKSAKSTFQSLANKILSLD